MTNWQTEAKGETAKVGFRDKMIERLEAENAALKAALVAHNDLLRGAFGAAQRDAIHEVRGTTNYNLLADAASKVLTKYHAVTNTARATLQKDQGK